MILDHNTTATVTSWDESKNQILTDTVSWKSSLNARLITAEEVAEITGNTNFDSSVASSMFYLDSNDNILTVTKPGESKYAWLFDYSIECTNYGCNVADDSNYGYWTSTPILDEVNMAWAIGRMCILGASGIDDPNCRGVRPVITISKDIIQ